MSYHDIWTDDAGIWVQVGEQTHGPFASAGKAERRADSITIGGECGCGECLRLLGAALDESDGLVLFKMDSEE